MVWRVTTPLSKGVMYTTNAKASLLRQSNTARECLLGRFYFSVLRSPKYLVLRFCSGMTAMYIGCVTCNSQRHSVALLGWIEFVLLLPRAVFLSYDWVSMNT